MCLYCFHLKHSENNASHLCMHSAPKIVLVKFMGLWTVLCFDLVQCLP